MASSQIESYQSGLPPPLICRRASLADAWNLTSIFIQSFREDEMSRWVSNCIWAYVPERNELIWKGQIYQYPTGDVPEHTRLLQFATRFRLPDFKRILVSSNYHAFVVEDSSTGQTVALSNWNIVPPESKAAWRNMPRIQTRLHSLQDRLRSWVYWAYDKIVSIVPLTLFRIFSPERAFYYERKLRWFKKVKKEFTDCIHEEDKRDGYWTLSHLGVLPEYGGRKIATSLMKWGMDQADKEDRAVYIIATSAGAPLYRSRGFDMLSSAKYFEGEPLGGWEVAMMRRRRKSERGEKQSV